MYNKDYYKKYYSKNSGRVLGYNRNYRQRHPNYMKLYWQKNKEKLRAQNKNYKKKNNDVIKLKKKEYYERNKEIIKNKKRLYYYNNLEKIKIKRKEYRLKNKELFKKLSKSFHKRNPGYSKINYHRNKLKILAKRKIDKQLNPEKWKKWESNYKNRKKLVDAIRYQKYRELENQRRRELGLPLIGENYKSEKEMKLYLNKILPNQGYKDNGRYEWLNGMELDRYYPKLKLAFEYHGEQHFHDREFFKVNLEEIKKRDKLKRELCRDQGVILIEISYLEKISEVLLLNKLGDFNIQTIQDKLIKRN